MSDPLMDFLLSCDRDKVLAEARPAVSLEKLYAEAPEQVRGVIDDMPVYVLRRKLALSEAKLVAARAEPRKPAVRVVGNRELVAALNRARQKISELEEIREDQARMIARLRGRRDAA